MGRESRYLTEALESRLLLSSQTIEVFGTSPAVFVQNKGQWTDRSVRFAYQGNGASIAMTDTGAFFRLFKADPEEGSGFGVQGSEPSSFIPQPSSFLATAFSVHFDGARRVRPTGQDRTGSVFNYYVGDKSQWRSNVPGYETLVYSNLYNGIDLATSGNHSSLKYEFRVDAGANYRKIKLSYDGINGLSIDLQGRLHIITDLGEVIDDAPYAYQMIRGRKVQVKVKYQLVDGDTYRFKITGRYDRSRALIIDPNLDWSSYLGGTGGDEGKGIAIDGSGSAWVAGYTYSSDLPAGASGTTYGSGGDAFVARISPDGTLVWTSYLGGGSYDEARSIAIDGADDAWVTGYTLSPSWVVGGFDTTLDGFCDGFVAKLNGDGTLAWSSYLGGAGQEYCGGIATSADGSGWLIGETSSPEWASDGFDTSFNGSIDAFVAKIGADGSLSWSSYLGGSGTDYGSGITLDGSGNALAIGGTASPDWASGGFDTSFNGTGSGHIGDAWVAKISANGSLAWSSYLGGPGDDYASEIASDASGSLWVTGTTYSDAWVTSGFDTTFGGPTDAFVAKINTNGALSWSSYLGGSGNEAGLDIALDLSGNAWLTGGTGSSNFAMGGFDTTFGGGGPFVAKINANGSLSWSSYLGGTSGAKAAGISIDPSGSAWVTGRMRSSDMAIGGFDTSFNGGTSDAFVAKISDLWPVVIAGIQFCDASPNQLRITFSRDVSANLSATSLAVTTLPGGALVTITGYGYNAATNTATFSLPTALAEGNYRAVLAAGNVIDAGGNPMQADYTFDFFVLGGDANHDRVVDICDLNALAMNWLGSGKVFSQGDFDYDGDVDADDLTILAGNWQKSLLPPVPGLPVSVRPIRRTPVKVMALLT